MGEAAEGLGAPRGTSQGTSRAPATSCCGMHLSSMEVFTEHLLCPCPSLGEKQTVNQGLKEYIHNIPLATAGEGARGRLFWKERSARAL